MTLALPIIPGFSNAKHTTLHHVPSPAFSVFPSYFAKFTEFFPAHARDAVVDASSAALLYAGKIIPDSRNISVA